MAYVGQCGSCLNFKDKDDEKIQYDSTNADYIKGFCTWYRCFYYPDDHCESHYRSKNSSGSGCYITTMVCDVLGYNDHCSTLETLRDFRSSVLQRDEQYKDLLYEYDTVGPEISNNLKKEEVSFVLKLYDNFLVPIVSCIRNNKNEEAISKYVTMTKSLEECYGIEYKEKAPTTYDYQKGGHGAVHKKKTYKLAI